MTQGGMSPSILLRYTNMYTFKSFLPISIAKKFALFTAKGDYTMLRLKHNSI